MLHAPSLSRLGKSLDFLKETDVSSDNNVVSGRRTRAPRTLGHQTH